MSPLNQLSSTRWLRENKVSRRAKGEHVQGLSAREHGHGNRAEEQSVPDNGVSRLQWRLAAARFNVLVCARALYCLKAAGNVPCEGTRNETSMRWALPRKQNVQQDTCVFLDVGFGDSSNSNDTQLVWGASSGGRANTTSVSDVTSMCPDGRDALQKILPMRVRFLPGIG